MIYKIYCNLNEQFVSDKINHGASAGFIGSVYTRNLTSREKASLVTTPNGKTWATLKGATNVLNRLNKVIPGAFEIKTFELKGE